MRLLGSCGVVTGARSNFQPRSRHLHCNPAEPAVLRPIGGPKSEEIVRAVLAEYLRHPFPGRVRVREGSAARVLRHDAEVLGHLARDLQPSRIELVHVEVRALHGCKRPTEVVDQHVAVERHLREIRPVGAHKDDGLARGLARARPSSL